MADAIGGAGEPESQVRPRRRIDLTDLSSEASTATVLGRAELSGA